MTNEASEEVINKLQQLGPSIATTFLIPPESYFEVITGLVDNFCRQNDLECIYVAAAVPAKTLSGAFESLELAHEHVKFVDCLSYATMQSIVDRKDVVYVESPSLLENIILSIEYLFKCQEGKRKIVIVDSINSLSLHNDARMLAEFIQIMMSSIKAKEAYPIILGLAGQVRPEVMDMLSLVSDQVNTIASRSGQ